MGVVQWLLLLLAIGGVIAIYVVTKRREGPNPWQDMQNPDVKGQEAVPPGPDTDFETPITPEQKTTSAPEFEGLLGADDVPELPEEQASQVDVPEDLPDYDIQPESVQESEASKGPEPELNPAGLKRKSAPEDQRIVVLHVASKNGEFFSGKDIHAALRECKLQFGMQDVYHRITEENGVPEPVFSVANMLKPGFLNPDEADDLQTPGLALFLVLPGPINGVPACRDMMETANQLAEKLGGEVLDDKRVLLKRQTAQFLLDEIAEEDRKRLIKAQHA